MKFSTTIILFFTLIFAIFILAAPILVLAQGEGDFIEITNPLKAKTVDEILTAITGLLKTIALPLAIIMVVWGGIQIMTGTTTGEKESKVVQGKKTITWAVIGYAIIFLVDFIVGFLGELLGKK